MIIFLLTRLFSWSWDLCLAGVTLCLHGVLVSSVLSPRAGGSLDSLCSPPHPACSLLLSCLLLCLPVSQAYLRSPASWREQRFLRSPCIPGGLHMSHTSRSCICVLCVCMYVQAHGHEVNFGITARVLPALVF